MFLRASLAFSLLLACSAGQAEIAFSSAHVLVVDEASGEVLLSKDGDSAAPIASLTKLMTAMVVLDAQQDPNELLRIEVADTNPLHRRGGLPVGAVASRGSLLEIALLASDNRAASALAHHYPGGREAFAAAMQRKIRALGLYSTQIEEPTGLSPNNISSGQDMVKVLRAAARYPGISQVTSQHSRTVLVNGRHWVVRNTNRLVGAPGWNVLLSKTGFTNDAGRCLAMRAEAGGRTVTIVLLGAARPSQRSRDAIAIRRWLLGEPAFAAMHAAGPRLRAMARRTIVMAPAPRSSPAAETTPQPAAASVEPSGQPAPIGEDAGVPGTQTVTK
jgi:D-alanyl-D-alanine carboxypeptidase/D-alanyl-D-alanine endopeptidase (penicillin-binding protein 7)